MKMAATGFLFSFIYIIRGVQVNTEKKGEIIRKTWKVLEQKMDRMRAIRNFLEIVVHQTNFPFFPREIMFANLLTHFFKLHVHYLHVCKIFHFHLVNCFQTDKLSKPQYCYVVGFLLKEKFK